MKFVLALNSIGVRTEELTPLAVRAEAAGFDGVMLGDHVVMPRTIEASAPYTKDGRSPMDAATPWPECLSALAFLLGATRRLRLLSSVLVLPMRQPLVVAKAVQTLAIMSGDRVVLGVGVGWLAEEFEALGMPFADRGARTDEAIAILRQAGATGQVEWHGRHFSIAPVSLLPRPSRPVPIYVGGDSPAALRRAALLGDGYLSTLRRSETLRRRAGELRVLREEAGRGDAPFEFVGVPADARTPDDFAALHAAGIHAAAVLPWKAPYDTSDPPMSEKLEAIDRFGEHVIEPLASP